MRYVFEPLVAALLLLIAYFTGEHWIAWVAFTISAVAVISLLITVIGLRFMILSALRSADVDEPHRLYTRMQTQMASWGWVSASYFVWFLSAIGYKVVGLHFNSWVFHGQALCLFYLLTHFGWRVATIQWMEVKLKK